MKEFYDILAKHFMQDTSPDEELLITKFREENPFEYQQLKRLWKAKGDIRVRDFDSQAAWRKVLKGVRNQDAKLVPLYRSRLGKVAAAAVFVVFSMLGYYYYSINTTPTLAQVTAVENGEMVLLGDGSKVWLNRDAILSYPENFEDDTRTVDLVGEAFFEVEKNPEKPFVVATQNAETRVLGTSFNVSSGQETTEVTVATGKVEVRSPNNEKVVVAPGYTAKVQGETVSFFVTTNLNYLSWKTGLFTFNETELTKVVADLNTYYTGQIRLENDVVTTCKITAEFDKVSLSEIMEMIELTCDVTINQIEGIYLIQ